MAGRLLGLSKVPVFQYKGDARVTTEFGKNIPDYPTPGKTGNHWGLDLVLWDGSHNTTTPIVAFDDGIVYAQRAYVKDGEKTPSGGNCIYILHKDMRTISKYLHLKQDSIPKKFRVDNVEVKKGELIGYMGSTGNSTGAHLHYQMEYTSKTITEIISSISGDPIDPEPYLLGKKIITVEDLWQVVIGEYNKETVAKQMQAALKMLGTDSRIEKV